MKVTHKFLDRCVHLLTIASLIFTACLGAILVLAEIRPFWVDEWFIIYNLKTKDVAGLLGRLELMQQFPRVYLVLLKNFTSCFDYSYFSLRLPSYILGLLIIFLSIKIMRRIYDKQVFARFLFVLMLVSSFTFTEYFVQCKQYTMDILLSILALWQLCELLELANPFTYARYFWLCLSFLIVPFFSYTYPIAAAPLYFITLLKIIEQLTGNAPSSVKAKKIAIVCFPLLIGAISILIFYIIDVKQLMADNAMHGFWSFLMFNDDHKFYSFVTCFYRLFSQLGAGIIFENIIGLLGVCAFIYGISSGMRDYKNKKRGLDVYIRLYCSLTLILTVILFLAKKMPLGDQRLNAFTMPSVIILIIYLLDAISKKMKTNWQKVILPIVLYLGSTGNILSTCITFFARDEYKKQMATYVATERAIKYAQLKKIPLFVTTGVSYPYEVAANPVGAPEPGTWMLKAFPAYKMRENLAIYSTKSTTDIKGCFNQLGKNEPQILVGDGINYKQISQDGTEGPILK